MGAEASDECKHGGKIGAQTTKITLGDADLNVEGNTNSGFFGMKGILKNQWINLQ
jgi:hypothetical protein